MNKKTIEELQTALDNAHWQMELADIHSDTGAWVKWAAIYHELLAEYNALCLEASQ